MLTSSSSTPRNSKTTTTGVGSLRRFAIKPRRSSIRPRPPWRGMPISWTRTCSGQPGTMRPRFGSYFRRARRWAPYVTRTRSSKRSRSRSPIRFTAVATLRLGPAPPRRRSSCRRGARGTNARGLLAHLPVFRGSIVVPAEEVQDSVRQQHRQLGEHVAPMCARLAPSRRHAENDVAQEVAGEVSQGALALREGQNVGGPVLAPVGAIQLLNRRVSGQNDRELGVTHLQRLEHRPGAAP